MLDVVFARQRPDVGHEALAAAPAVGAVASLTVPLIDRFAMACITGRQGPGTDRENQHRNPKAAPTDCPHASPPTSLSRIFVLIAEGRGVMVAKTSVSSSGILALRVDPS